MLVEPPANMAWVLKSTWAATAGRGDVARRDPGNQPTTPVGGDSGASDCSVSTRHDGTWKATS